MLLPYNPKVEQCTQKKKQNSHNLQQERNHFPYELTAMH